MANAADDNESHQESYGRCCMLLRPTYMKTMVPTLLVGLGASVRMHETLDWPTDFFTFHPAALVLCNRTFKATQATRQVFHVGT